MSTEARDRMQRLSFMVPLDEGDTPRDIPGPSKRVAPMSTVRDAIREAQAETHRDALTYLRVHVIELDAHPHQNQGGGDEMYILRSAVLTAIDRALGDD